MAKFKYSHITVFIYVTYYVSEKTNKNRRAMVAGLDVAAVDGQVVAAVAARVPVVVAAPPAVAAAVTP